MFSAKKTYQQLNVTCNTAIEFDTSDEMYANSMLKDVNEIVRVPYFI